MRNLLTIIIPVRREEETIRRTLQKLKRSVHVPHSVIIADDHIDPDDHTCRIVREMRMNGVHICPKRSGDADGFGPSLVRAIRTVTTPYTVIVMADMSDDPKTIAHMLDMAREGEWDIVCGSRYLPQAAKIGGPKLQSFLSTALNWMLHHLLGVPTSDATNAFKLYRTAFLQSILPHTPASGVEFSLQLLLHALEKQPRIADVPTVWRGREAGQSKVRLFSRGPKYLSIVLEHLNNV